MSQPSELREALAEAIAVDPWDDLKYSTESFDARVDAALDAFIASLPEEHGSPRAADYYDGIDDGRMDMLAEVKQLLQSAKSTSKEKQ